jgi:hypothetical protein
VTKAINAASCSVITLVDDIIKGEVDKKVGETRWAGVAGTITAVQDVANALKNVSDHSADAFANNEYTLTYENDFKGNLTLAYDKYKDKTLPSPNPEASDRIKPIYVQKYQNLDSKDSALNLIWNEYQIKIATPMKLLKEAKENSGIIGTNLSPITSTLNSIIDYLGKLKDSIQQFSDKVVNAAVIKYVIYFLINLHK